MLGSESSQGHRQVKSQPYLAAAVVLEMVELSIRFFAPLAAENFQVFQGGWIDGAEAIRALDLASGFHETLTWDHRFRQVIPKTLEGSRLD